MFTTRANGSLAMGLINRFTIRAIHKKTLPPVVNRYPTAIVPKKEESAKVTSWNTEVTEPELRTDRPVFYHDQVEWLDERIVRISKPSKNVMQSGTAALNSWKIEFNSQARWEDDLMGWTSSSDPVSNLSLNFPTREAAIEFCEKNKLQWFVEEQQERKVRRKSYADNFSWNKRTRLGNK